MSSFFGIGAGGESAFYPYEIEKSLRFDDGSSAYLTQTFSAGDRDLYTISFWMKRCTLGTAQYVIGAHSGAAIDGGVFFNSSDQIGFSINGNVYNKITNAKFRDSSAWYHFVFIYDSNQSTAADRIKIYVNNVEQTSYFTQNSGLPTSSYDTLYFNNNKVHSIGKLSGYDTGYLDAYLADVNFIDGQALAPTNFGETKSEVWIPKDTSGLTFGTNGFRLEFGDSSDIGNDTSGQNNDWSATNLSTHDVVSDSPTNNWGMLNVLSASNISTISYSEGTLKLYNSSAYHKTAFGNMGMVTGKWYWEARAGTGTKFTIGLSDIHNQYYKQLSTTNAIIGYTPSGLYTRGDAVGLYADTIYKNGSSVASSSFGSYSSGDIYAIAFDADAGKIWFSRNGTWRNGSATASTTLNADNHDTTVTVGETYIAAFSTEQAFWNINFGQNCTFNGNETHAGNTDANGIGEFHYAVPSGFSALCASNLPEPTISPNQDETPSNHFNVLTYTGNGSNTAKSMGHQTDWLWIKQRNATQNHVLQDVVRGVGKYLLSDVTNAEATSSTQVISFDTDGFTVGTAASTNDSSDTYVAWSWKAGGSATSNSEGTITSSVSANTEAGFSIVGYTGLGSGYTGSTVGHGLGGVPELMIVRRRNATANWFVYHHQANGVNSSDPETDYHTLETTNARADNAGPWNDTAPTSTVFTVGADGWTNSAGTYVAYLFRSIQGYSKVGAYTGFGSTDGPFIYTGFRPRYILGKSSNASYNWFTHDTARDVDNPTISRLFSDSSGAENSSEAESTYGIDFLSNGFKIRASHVTTGSSAAYIYWAFAEMPFKYANAR